MKVHLGNDKNITFYLKVDYKYELGISESSDAPEVEGNSKKKKNFT